MNPQPTRFRFGLRSLLAAVFVVAIFAAFPMLLHVLAWLAWLTGPLIALAMFTVVRNATRSHAPRSAERWPNFAGWLFFLVAAIPLVVCWFIRHRWVNAYADDLWPRPFPYPDEYLSHIHDWWDRLNPAESGYLKMHGEYYAVLQGTNALVLVACVLFGAVTGYVFRNRNSLPPRAA